MPRRPKSVRTAGAKNTSFWSSTTVTLCISARIFLASISDQVWWQGVAGSIRKSYPVSKCVPAVDHSGSTCFVCKSFPRLCQGINFQSTKGGTFTGSLHVQSLLVVVRTLWRYLAEMYLLLSPHIGRRLFCGLPRGTRATQENRCRQRWR